MIRFGVSMHDAYFRHGLGTHMRGSSHELKNFETNLAKNLMAG